MVPEETIQTIQNLQRLPSHWDSNPVSFPESTQLRLPLWPLFPSFHLLPCPWHILASLKLLNRPNALLLTLTFACTVLELVSSCPLSWLTTTLSWLSAYVASIPLQSEIKQDPISLPPFTIAPSLHSTLFFTHH